MPELQSPQAAYRHRGFSTVWIIPLLALIIAGWTGWTSWHGKGSVITITFEKVQGVEPQRTQIRHKGVTLGTVTKITPSADFKSVVVTAQMLSLAEPYLTKGTQFWVVHPRVSVGSISDLNTLVSGVYIEMAPVDGDQAKDFTGREDPLAVDSQDPGRNFTLHATQLGSLEQGSPVYFRGLKVGEVSNFELATGNDILIHVFVNQPYEHLVMKESRFWNVSGIGITAGTEGFRIAAQSLQAVVQGGITFDVPDGAPPSEPAAEGGAFTLYATSDAAQDSVYTKKIDYMLRFAGTTQGLDAGGSVNLLGNSVGHVVSKSIHVDPDTGQALSQVVVEIEPERIHFMDGKKGGAIEQKARDAFAQMVKHKLRAQMASTSLLTGQKNIDFEFVDDAPPASIAIGGTYPEFPTAASYDIAAVMRDASDALRDTDNVIRSAGPEIKPLLQSARGASDQIGNTLNTDNGSGGLSGTLDEMRQAARAVRDLATYLDAHPESLLRGKEESSP